MLRVTTVIVSSLLFALLGLAIGYLCVDTVKIRSPEKLDDEFILICYMAPPAAGALMGFLISFIAMRWATPRHVVGDHRG